MLSLCYVLRNIQLLGCILKIYTAQDILFSHSGIKRLHKIEKLILIIRRYELLIIDIYKYISLNIYCLNILFTWPLTQVD